ncbi:hypothetical protein DCAR_0312408 [Daucus carota subsp. sativus]|uniref:Reverse transcriptase zinc-binding domain-containing protein n=1 Tax=Daucus carota subsp. sativus TaxID=79200 RepID=A0AAF0WNC9_DAUCS|nr:PREDICTED: uncharacterized protein LOC108212540 [Daucus carota subsp. sativus]WOG93127.1 hypothetical protein DCAR_0312408 [Daucus carota subsp. sativus]
MKCPWNASWIIKKLFMLREVTLQHISYTIENGSGTSLWFDSWNSNRPFCTFADHPLVSHSSLGKDTNDADILSPSGWNLHVANYYDFHDMNWWDNVCGNKVKVTNIRESLRYHSNSMPWAKCVWHKLQVPRHDRVNTADKLVDFDVCSSTACNFCINGREQIRIYSSNAPSLGGLCRLFFTKDVIYLRLHGLTGING